MRSLIFLLLFSSQAFSALYIRDLDGDWSNGHEGVHDDVLDITWLADANYAYTSGYAAANATGSPSGLATHIQADGRMGWDAAMAWAGQLEYASYDDWRLPINVMPDTSCSNYPFESTGYNCTGNELGHMFYNNLGNTAHYSILNNVSFTDATYGDQQQSFLNVQSNAYWLGEEYAPNTVSAWVFFTTDGYQDPFDKELSGYSWAVHDGDIGLAPVPLPSAIWFFLTALVGITVKKLSGRNA